jgi:thiamine biosynthesis lipoprotein
LVSLWDITGDPYLPTQEEIDSLLPLVDYQVVELDENSLSVYLPTKGMKLDLGAIAKGYAADESAAILTSAGVRSAILDLGGNIVILGSKPDDSPWRVGIQNPFSPRGNHLAIYDAQDLTLVSSGVYERFFIQDGIRYHHILNPSTGYPSDSGIAGVTIISDSSIQADALSTAAFVLGVEKGTSLINSFSQVEAVFVTNDKEIFLTSKLGDSLRFTDENFTVY